MRFDAKHMTPGGLYRMLPKQHTSFPMESDPTGNAYHLYGGDMFLVATSELEADMKFLFTGEVRRVTLLFKGKLLLFRFKEPRFFRKWKRIA